ncbi:hypothetical protein BBAD15_g12409 [Beauveria bassiana D1-5]|uniref:Uncharacterized protein n=1 Tax=Beauveria bassiana D1-5 TaxID=1245745 RepID=A0A0A2V8E8_BEABA|nr:hypothetical protein BBAD15_g12409 [Beauveria bassiana D1-5]
MDWAQRWLLTFLGSMVAAVYWLLAARARSAAKSRRQSQVAQDHRPDHSVPERTKDRTRKRLTVVYPEQTRDAADDAEVEFADALAILYGLLLISDPEAFLYASDDSRYESLLKTTAGLVFLGTPFRGSKWQPLANALAQLMGPAGSHSGITRELGFDEPALRDRVHRFCKLCNKLSTAVACFSELYETDYGRRLGIVGVAKGMVVDETSACIPGLDRYALDKDHLKINKYYGPTDPAFERVSDVISKMCRRANDVVRRRFESAYSCHLV